MALRVVPNNDLPTNVVPHDDLPTNVVPKNDLPAKVISHAPKPVVKPKPVLHEDAPWYQQGAFSNEKKTGLDKAMDSSGHAIMGVAAGPLNALSNVFETGSEAIDSTLRNDPKTMKPVFGGDLPKLISLWKEGKFDEARDEYSFGSPGELKYGIKAHRPGAELRAKNPKVNAVETFVEESVNPMNELPGAFVGRTGKLMHALGEATEPAANAVKAAKIAGKSASPMDHAIAFAHNSGKAISRIVDNKLTNKYRGINDSGGNLEEAAHRGAESYVAKATGEAGDKTMAIFGGLTHQDMRNVIHASQGNIEPHFTPDILQRGSLLRKTLMDLDQTQLAKELIEPERVNNSSTFFPMSRPNTYEDPKLVGRSEDVINDLKETRGAGSFSGPIAERKGTSSINGKSKVFQTLKESEQLGKLADTFDPAANLFGHLAQRYQNIAAHDYFESVAQRADLLVPLQYRDEKLGLDLGEGEEGYANATKHAAKLNNQKAFAQTQADLGYAPNRFKNVSTINAKLQEARSIQKRQAGLLPAAQDAVVKTEAKAGATLSSNNQTLTDYATKVIGDKAASAQDRADAMALLSEKTARKTRRAAEQRLKTRLAGGTIQNTTLSAGLGAAFGGAKRLTPEQTTLKQVIKPSEDAAGKAREMSQGTKDEVNSAADQLKARMQKINVDKQAQAIASNTAGVASKVFKNDSAMALRVTALTDKFFTTTASNDAAKVFRDAQAEKLSHMSVADTRNKLIDRSGIPKNHELPSEALLRTGSKAVKHSSIDVQLKKLLEHNGATPNQSNPVIDAWSAVNDFSKTVTIANPAYHLVWNLPMNYLVAGGSPENLRFLSASLRGTKNNAEYNELFARAEANGAIAHLPGRGMNVKNINTLIANHSDQPLLNRIGKDVQQKTMQAANLNSHITFERGEEGFAVGLFKSFIDKGMDDSQAGIEVRKALGDFANISNFEKGFTKIFWFYPWMKTIVPLWIKGAAMHPQYYSGVQDNMQEYNESQGQKRDYIHPYDIKSADGTTTGIPGAASTVTNMLANPTNSVVTRFNPLMRIGYNELLTYASSTGANQPGFVNPNIVADKNAPLNVQAMQQVQSMGNTAMPQQAKDAYNFFQPGITAKKRAADVAGLAGLPATRDKSNQAAVSAIYKLTNERNITMALAKKAGYTQDQLNDLYARYQKVIDPYMKQFQANQ